jgi:hypothetical protein
VAGLIREAIDHMRRDPLAELLLVLYYSVDVSGEYSVSFEIVSGKEWVD